MGDTAISPILSSPSPGCGENRVATRGRRIFSACWLRLAGFSSITDASFGIGERDGIMERDILNDSPALLPNLGLGPWDFVSVGAYLLVTFGVSAWAARRQTSTEDFFVGGRRMPWIAVGLSILATLFSTISYLGVPGEAVKNGIGLSLGYLAVPFSFAVVSIFWIPFFMRLRLTSAYEYLERRFDRSLRKLGATLFILLRLGWMSMVVFVVSLAVDKIIGSDLKWLPGADIYWIIALIGVTAAVYTAMGGIEAVIWVDVLQCLLLLSGVLLAIGYVALVDRTGPVDWWNTVHAKSELHTTPIFFSTDLTIRVTIFTAIISNFFWTICTHGSDQVVLQRYFSTSSARQARGSYIINVVVDLTMASLLAVAGFALLTFYLKHASLLPDNKTAVTMADDLFPYFLGHQLPAGFAGLILSAFLCDAIQTLESGVNSIVAVATRDLLMSSQTSEREADKLVAGSPEARLALTDLFRVRVFSALLAIVVACNAYGVAYLRDVYKLTIIDMMPKFFNMFVGPLAALFFVGMFWSRCTSRSVWPAAILGLTVSIIWSWWETIFLTSWRPTILLAIACPCLVTFFSARLISQFVDPPRRTDEVEYSWRSVIRNRRA